MVKGDVQVGVQKSTQKESESHCPTGTHPMMSRIPFSFNARVVWGNFLEFDGARKKKC